MNWLTNMNLKNKLIFGFGTVIMIIVILIISTFHGLMKIREAQNNIFNKEIPVITQLSELRSLINMQLTDSFIFLFIKDQNQRTITKNSIQQRRIEIDNIFNKIFNTIPIDDPSISNRLIELKSVREEMVKTRDEVVQLTDNGKNEEARMIVTQTDPKLLNKFREIYTMLANKLNQDTKKSIQDTESMTNTLTIILLLLGSFGIIFTIILIITLNNMIAKPINHLSTIAERIATGDIDVPLTVSHRLDEVGVLEDTFHKMTGALKSIADVAKKITAGDLSINVKPVSANDILGHAIESMVKGLHVYTTEIIDAVNILNTSTSLITTSTSQLAASANETATAVTETTSTIEEVRQTSQVSNQKALSVSENAKGSGEFTKVGKKATNETNEGMRRIRDQMTAIAENMMKLSEQTQSITSIIETVDDLSQQSNLLAVNAYIEAEKAGEQGRGFRVVAQEIKSLADQSKQATHRVRDILSDIQKATNTAVLATEQGNKVVSVNVKKAEETSESILSLSKNISDAVDATLQIAASSQQQLVGMEQAATAMENIKLASKQNLEGAKELEIAAHNLKDLGNKLKQLVSKYKI